MQIKFGAEVNKVLNEIRDLLLERNAKYGNSALDPKRIFSKASPVEQLYVRLDDKLSRINNGEMTDEVLNDTIGYLIILRIARKLHTKKKGLGE